MEWFTAKSRITAAVLLAGLFPWLVSLVARSFFGNAQHINEPLHEFFELAGSSIALLVAMLLVFRDVAERRRAEETLKQTEDALRRLAAIVESSDDAIISKNLDGIIMTWNRGAEQLYGYCSAEAVGRPMQLIVPPERQHEMPELFGRVQHGEHVESYETVRARKDGCRVEVSITLSPIKDVKGHIIGGAVIARDITARKQMERQLRSASAYARSLIEASLDPLVTISPAGKITDVNQSTERVTGVPRGQLIGSDFSDYFTDPAKAAEGYRQVLAQGLVRDYPLRIRHTSGTTTDVLYNAALFRNETGEVQGVFAAARDITELKRAEDKIQRMNLELERRVVERTAQLEAANNELEAFAYSVSHDLRAPLRAIDGFSRILLKEYSPELSAEAKRYFQIVRNNTQQMGHLIDDLLAFSRLSRQPLKKQLIPAGDLVRCVVDDLRREDPGRAIELTIGDLPSCSADAALLKQVFVNLLSNAFKFTRNRNPARILVGHRNLSGKDAYFVQDNGVGFDTRYAGKLFGVFQRLHRADEYEGTGVGLAIVKRIIQRHGGRIWAEAEPDQGATFFFTLEGEPIGE